MESLSLNDDDFKNSECQYDNWKSLDFNNYSLLKNIQDASFTLISGVVICGIILAMNAALITINAIFTINSKFEGGESDQGNEDSQHSSRLQ